MHRWAVPFAACVRFVTRVAFVGIAFASFGVAAASVGGERLAAQLSPDAGPAGGAGPARDARLVPVLLLPGWGDDAEALAALEGRFVAAGWEDGSVARLSFRDAVGSNEAHSREIAAAVTELLRTTGVAEVDVVAHSMGGLALRRYLADPTARAAVRRVVFLATPHRGTVWAALAWGDGAAEMVPGSDFLEALNGTPLDPGEVGALALRTPIDTHVMPGSSALLPEARNVEICCPSHYGLIDHEAAFREIQAFLRSESAR